MLFLSVWNFYQYSPWRKLLQCILHSFIAAKCTAWLNGTARMVYSYERMLLDQNKKGLHPCDWLKWVSKGLSNSERIFAPKTLFLDLRYVVFFRLEFLSVFSLEKTSAMYLTFLYCSSAGKDCHCSTIFLFKHGL